MSKQIVEYTIRMDKETSDKLVEMSEASGEDNELVYLEEMVIEMINKKIPFSFITTGKVEV